MEVLLDSHSSCVFDIGDIFPIENLQESASKLKDCLSSFHNAITLTPDGDIHLYEKAIYRRMKSRIHQNNEMHLFDLSNLKEFCTLSISYWRNHQVTNMILPQNNTNMNSLHESIRDLVRLQ